MSADKPTKTSGRSRSARKRPSPDMEMPVDVAPTSDLAVAPPAAAQLADRQSTPDELEAQIRRRAYELYVSRGGNTGDDLTDWLEAERSVRSSHSPDDGDATQHHRA